MTSIIKILIAAIIVTAIGCTDNWDDHYNKQPETINTNVWKAIKGKSELSSFVAMIEKYKYDTLFLTDDTYTIFVPDNAAMAKLVKSQVSDTTILNYHISRHFIQPVDIQGKRKLQTFAEKYSTFEYLNGKPTYDGIALYYESPLYINGKFFVMSEVAVPKLNLYEFIAKNNTYLKAYIDSKDTIIIDQEKSRPIGFDENGNTVYDTVSIKANMFEYEYFPVSSEFRKWAVTLVYPKQANYENGLNLMAQKLGGKFIDYRNIPIRWQEEILIPHLLKHGFFLNMLEPYEFVPVSALSKRRKFTMMNINGDSIVTNYTPVNPYLSSNGIFYDYANFEVPDSLFSGSEKMEGEWLARTTGINRYAWRKEVSVTSTTNFNVFNQYIKGASNDSILSVNFTKGYKGIYKVQFNTKNLFPRKYRMEVHTHMDIGGIYDIYVNNILVKTFDYYDYVKGRGLIKSVTGETFAPTGRYNRFDCYVDNITDYGKPTIRFEYKAPGSAPNNGLVIDVIKFIPVVE